MAHKGISTALFALLLLAWAVPTFAADWPDRMTAEELAPHTNVHDGYVVRVLPLQSAPVQQSTRIAPSESTLDYFAGYSSKRKEWIPLADGKMRRGLSVQNTGTGPDLALSIQLVSNGDLLLTDGTGSKTGFDVGNRIATAEIPGSLYRRRPHPPSLASDPHAAPLRLLSVSRPQPASYVLAVGGTHGDPYYLTVGMYQVGNSITLIQADARVSSDIEYRIIVKSDPRRLRVIGGFDGNPRSSDKDQLLTFASPTRSRTQLPTGTTQTEILMFYAPGIELDSLGAKLNGKDVKARFHPYEGWREVVRLPLEPGDNILEIGIKGSIDGKRTREKKRLTFTVSK